MPSSVSIPNLESKNNLICTACGTQYDVVLPPKSSSSSSLSSQPNDDNNESQNNDSDGDQDPFIPASSLECPLKSCRICDDPRQYVPPSGQKFTTLERMWSARSTTRWKNVFEKVKGSGEQKVIEVWTEPKFGIGQRACILQTPHGNVMWDLVAYLDSDTVEKIHALGGLKLIIISHPHFYTTWTDWSTTFGCPIYLSHADATTWLNRPSSHPNLYLLTSPHTELLPGLTAIISGGHFEGSLMLHSSPPNTTLPSLFVADTIMSVPSASNPPTVSSDNPNQYKYFTPSSLTMSYTFMYSIPNMIPLSPAAIRKIWRSLDGFDFRATYGVMAGSSNIWEREGDREEKGLMGLKERVGRSMRIFLERGGWKGEEIEGIGV